MLRMALEQELERAEAAKDVLRRVGAVDADDQPFGAIVSKLGVPGDHERLVASASNSLGVHRDRAGNGLCPASVELDVRPIARAEQADRSVDERPAPALRVEADEVVREHAGVHGPAHVGRQHAPAVGADPRDVDEMREPRLRTPVANEARREIEVVVVEEDRRAGLALELVADRVGEVAVDRRVARVPGLAERSRRSTGSASRSQSRCWMNHSIGLATTS